MHERIIRKVWLLLVFLALFSCRTEEIISSDFVQQNKGYSNKSLWKEDEVFIKNVKKIYNDNADKTRMKSRYGEIFWDYATSMNTFDETYLIAPILKDGKILSYVEARRVGNKVFFEFTEGDGKTNDFFSTLIFTKTENLKAGENPTSSAILSDFSYSAQSAITRTLECKTVTKTLVVGYVEGGGPNQGGEITETYHETICKFVDGPVHQDTCIGIVDQFGNCEGGGGNGGGGGYYYPDPEEEEVNEDCTKIERIGKNEKTKNLFKDLDQKKNQLVPGTNKYSEKGYLLTGSADGTISESYVEGQAGELEISLTIPNQIDGFIHSHYLGGLSVFSVSDLATLAWMYKNGKIKDFKSFIMGVVTSSGTHYILTIDNISQFNNFASSLLNTNNEYTEKDKNAQEWSYATIFRISPNTNGSLNEQRFMAYLETQTSGLKILKANDDTYTSWSVLARKSDGTVQLINCNN